MLGTPQEKKPNCRLVSHFSAHWFIPLLEGNKYCQLCHYRKVPAKTITFCKVQQTSSAGQKRFCTQNTWSLRYCNTDSQFSSNVMISSPLAYVTCHIKCHCQIHSAARKLEQPFLKLPESPQPCAQINVFYNTYKANEILYCVYQHCDKEQIKRTHGQLGTLSRKLFNVTHSKVFQPNSVLLNQGMKKILMQFFSEYYILLTWGQSFMQCPLLKQRWHRQLGGGLLLGFLASEERDRSEKCSVRELNPSTMLLSEP